MSCIITQEQLNSIDQCIAAAGGIQKFWVLAYEQDLRGRIVVDLNGDVVDIYSSKNIIEFSHNFYDNFSGNYVENYDNEKKKYDVRFELSLVGWSGQKMPIADTLAKGSWVFIWLDYNGRYWMSFFENGSDTEEAEFSTQTRRNRQDYRFVFTAKQSTNALELLPQFVEPIDCDNLNNTIDAIDALGGSASFVGSYLDCPLADVVTFDDTLPCP